MSKLKDVADLAGVSPATVSRAINHPDTVRPPLRARVRSAMDQLNYRPNMVAKSLKTKVTGNIGIVLNDMLHFDISSTADALGRQRLNLILRDSENNWGLESSHIHQLIDQHVDGLLVSAVGVRHEGLVHLQEQGVPTVLLGEEIDGLAFPHVSYDVLAGSYHAVNHLLAQGHTQIGFIAGASDNRVRRDLFDGFRLAHEKLKLEVQSRLVRTNMPNPNGGEKTMCQLLRLGKRPTALFVAHPRMAQGVMKTIFAASLQCPRDISIVVFGDSEWARASFPPLTVLEPQGHLFGDYAVTSLVKLIKNELPRERWQVRVPTVLIERNSVGPVHNQDSYA